MNINVCGVCVLQSNILGTSMLARQSALYGTDRPIPIPSIQYRRYWLTQRWYQYAQAVATCYDTCARRTAHV